MRFDATSHADRRLPRNPACIAGRAVRCSGSKHRPSSAMPALCQCVSRNTTPQILPNLSISASSVGPRFGLVNHNIPDPVLRPSHICFRKGIRTSARMHEPWSTTRIGALDSGLRCRDGSHFGVCKLWMEFALNSARGEEWGSMFFVYT